ncbi:transglutaminase-like domain-containing protein [Thermococcus aggregans]|uniref:Transglutaminase-like domain-containing protein n=1 Tax=Thermococcus aggregans TaxID=110163 RepID=A0A9E7MWP6_THEAG|nr:transglutaminase-like domain-containing protein [Thermococcus aggregans]USS40205.1 transglutaminase-like domain-containing protein [Thermococcus aggregans]
MKHLKLIPIVLAFLVLSSGCLIKEPAKVDISIDKTAVKVGDVFHVVVKVNNTGKVAIIGVNLYINNPDFRILQRPSLDAPLKVGDVAELIWIVQAPSKPGRYMVKASVEVVDELQRTWGGFYKELVMNVVENESEIPAFGVLSTSVAAPEEVEGGNEFEVKITLKNTGNAPVTVREVSLNLLDGMEVIKEPDVPVNVLPKREYTLIYVIKAPYKPEEGYLTISVVYSENGNEKRELKNKFIKVIWRPWNYDDGTLRLAYGEEYYWIALPYLVDGFWKEKFNSTSRIDRELLRNESISLVKNATSEVEAAKAVYNMIKSRYSFGDITTTTNPTNILPQNKISYEEGTLLFTGILRSLNIPARVVTLYNGNDCTENVISEFYSAGKWYVVDFKKGFFGSREEYMATPYFPRIYQMVTNELYNLVAQAPEEEEGHEHVDVSPEYLANIEDSLKEVVLERLNPTLRPKLSVVLIDMNQNERIFTLFLFASAPQGELNLVFQKADPKNLAKNVDALYNFYKDKQWPENFREYWNILMEVYR